MYIANFGRLQQEFILWISALSRINVSISKDPETWYYLDSKAWMLYRMGRYEEADEDVNSIQAALD